MPFQTRSLFIFLASFHLTAHSSSSPGVVPPPRQCQEVRYDCIIRYRSGAPACSAAWYWFLRPEQEAWNCPCSEFHQQSVFICQENIHALLSLSARLSVCLLLCHVCISQAFWVSIKYLFAPMPFMVQILCIYTFTERLFGTRHLFKMSSLNVQAVFVCNCSCIQSTRKSE